MSKATDAAEAKAEAATERREAKAAAAAKPDLLTTIAHAVERMCRIGVDKEVHQSVVAAIAANSPEPKTDAPKPE